MEIFIGLIVGILASMLVLWLFQRRNAKVRVQTQSVILLERIKKVYKFITVEGDFAEIYHYEDAKDRFLNLLSSKKKALVVINAKAQVGYDFSKVQLKANTKLKTIVIQSFPQPEVLGVQTDLNYYDKKDGMFNKFEASDLTGLNKAAKQHILDKIPESGLFQVAQKEAMEAIALIENIVQTIGWKLDYSALEIEENHKPLLP
ncbi:hypothetical protein IA57_07125 [Mangrovimonas yunxiaonensis]|uniref:DUF4230 domain-containing protein n=1 Tax=Mangrovimonas yunxiaonensis TaxID=1197477 RepID=A0A084TLK8_9FLAO|nr:DUF4230 domain-containing protein [Mangrovimonas yunxiaonensis]KFB01594.1 hypothetical protein IA57_07125 [Mangrovimonas yunxiaonensis]MBR9756793.1 DUF4230 domain-containing protein [Algicola sp.]GGH35761.1 hypothetical protein GCM10011364_02540 [Mangrovimonas yunxiaonensis]